MFLEKKTKIANKDKSEERQTNNLINFYSAI